jgi:hypothetical protein
VVAIAVEIKEEEKGHEQLHRRRYRAANERRNSADERLDLFVQMPIGGQPVDGWCQRRVAFGK